MGVDSAPVMRYDGGGARWRAPPLPRLLGRLILSRVDRPFCSVPFRSVPFPPSKPETRNPKPKTQTATRHTKAPQQAQAQASTVSPDGDGVDRLARWRNQRSRWRCEARCEARCETYQRGPMAQASTVSRQRCEVRSRRAGSAGSGAKSVRSRYESTKVRKYEGTKVRRYESTKVRRYEGTKVRKCEAYQRKQPETKT